MYVAFQVERGTPRGVYEITVGFASGAGAIIRIRRRKGEVSSTLLNIIRVSRKKTLYLINALAEVSKASELDARRQITLVRKRLVVRKHVKRLVLRGHPDLPELEGTPFVDSETPLEIKIGDDEIPLRLSEVKKLIRVLGDFFGILDLPTLN